MLSRLLAVAAVLGFSAPPSPGRAPAPFPKDARAAQPAPEVQVIGVYEGARPPGARAAGAVTVKAGGLGRPVILVLTSYEPVVWKVEAPMGAVVRVVAAGYHRQTVEGLDGKVPVTLLSHEGGDKDYFYAYRKEAPAAAPGNERDEARRNWGRLLERVKKLTGQDVKSFQGKYAGSSFAVR